MALATEVEHIRERLQEEAGSIREGKSADLEEVVERLGQGEEETLAYRLWEYADREKLDRHFRDFGYEDPQDVIESLERIDRSGPDKNSVRELRALKDYVLRDIYLELED